VNPNKKVTMPPPKNRRRVPLKSAIDHDDPEASSDDDRPLKSPKLVVLVETPDTTEAVDESAAVPTQTTEAINKQDSPRESQAEAQQTQSQAVDDHDNEAQQTQSQAVDDHDNEAQQTQSQAVDDHDNEAEQTQSQAVDDHDNEAEQTQSQAVDDK
jgi:hypothetical protein